MNKFCYNSPNHILLRKRIVVGVVNSFVVLKELTKNELGSSAIRKLPLFLSQKIFTTLTFSLFLIFIVLKEFTKNELGSDVIRKLPIFLSQIFFTTLTFSLFFSLFFIKELKLKIIVFSNSQS